MNHGFSKQFKQDVSLGNTHSKPIITFNYQLNNQNPSLNNINYSYQSASRYTPQSCNQRLL